MNRTQVGQVGGPRRRDPPGGPADLPALADFFAGLSVQARYLRFFAPITPGPALLNLLCGGGGTTDAVLATRDGVIIGHGMAADRSGPCGARTTDIGVVVADAWQRQGVGSALVRALITGAQVRGVTSVTMDVLPGNRSGARHDQGSLARRSHPSFQGLRHLLRPASARPAVPAAGTTRSPGHAAVSSHGNSGSRLKIRYRAGSRNENLIFPNSARFPMPANCKY